MVFAFCTQSLHSRASVTFTSLPIAPGFLAFREVPTLLEAWRKLVASKPEVTPQVVLIDGNGVLHPHGFGKIFFLIFHMSTLKLYRRNIEAGIGIMSP